MILQSELPLANNDMSLIEPEYSQRAGHCTPYPTNEDD